MKLIPPTIHGCILYRDGRVEYESHYMTVAELVHDRERKIEDEKREAATKRWQARISKDPDYDLCCDLCGSVFGRADGDLNCCVFICTACCK